MSTTISDLLVALGFGPNFHSRSLVAQNAAPYRMCLRGVRAMWIITMFDLPVVTKKQRRHYRQFHDALLGLGFSRLQFSIYGRPCASPENADYQAKRVKDKMPPEGEVRVMKLTALQFSRMEIFHGKKSGKPESPPEQISLF